MPFSGWSTARPVLIVAYSLTHPALLWGLLFVAVPVLIHLALRPRPRRLSFPALVLMHAVLLSGERASRVRSILLLLLRVALLACAALLLAAPTCAPTAGGLRGSGPVACVIILDNSLSMTYRPRFDDPTTLLDRAREQALAFLETAQSWPARSELAVLRTSATDETPPLTADRAVPATALRSIGGDAVDAQPLGHALQQSASLLRNSPLTQRQIVVFTDATASAWRDVQPSTLAGLEALTVHVIAPPAAPATDLSLLAAELPARVHPASATLPLHATVAATGVTGECWLVVQQDEQVLARVGPLEVPAGGQRDVALRLPPLPPGPHAVTLQLEPEDLLAADQRRYVTWQTGPQPVAWLLAPSSGGPDQDLSTLICSNLLAPTVLSPSEQRIAVRFVSANDVVGLLNPPAGRRVDDLAARRPALVVVFPSVELSDAAREALRRALDIGTTMLLVPGSATTATDWPAWRSLLTETAPLVDIPAGGVTIRWESTPGDTLAPDELLELSRCRVNRRLRLTNLLAGVQTVATYADGQPAIVSRAVGKGRILALTTSPDPQWSDLGVRAAGLLMWLHHLIEQTVGPLTAVAQFTAGETPQTVFAALPASGLVQVTPQGLAPGKPTWVRLTEGIPQRPWPTDVAGIYTVHPAEQRGGLAQYAVNWPAEEFDLTHIDRPGLVRVLGTEQVTLETPESRPGGTPPGLFSRLLHSPDLTTPLGLLLLLLFVAEMAAGRRAQGQTNGSPEQ